MISIIMPTYNEAGNIKELILRVEKEMDVQMQEASQP